MTLLFFEAMLEGGGACGQGWLHDDGHGVGELSWNWNMLYKHTFAPTYWRMRTIHAKTKIWEPKIPTLSLKLPPPYFS